jgi:hypothetical protein
MPSPVRSSRGFETTEVRDGVNIDLNPVGANKR